MITPSLPESSSSSSPKSNYDKVGTIAFALVHVACILVIWVGISWVAVLACFFWYFVRMFAITGAYHRYFSHHTYKTSRPMQFALALLGTTAAQKGVLWWAVHHRHHHRHSDTEEDIHSPGLHGIWWAHVGWICSHKYEETDYDGIKDFSVFPELRFLNRQHHLPPMMLAGFNMLLGWFLEVHYPGLGTNAVQMLIWGFFVSTVLLYHGTFCINSFAHLIGRKRFKTGDESKNSLALALITLGEGWHNNHHYYPGSERQGFYWWEIDITHYILRGMSFLGLVWDLRGPPEEVKEKGRVLDMDAAAGKGAA